MTTAQGPGRPSRPTDPSRPATGGQALRTLLDGNARFVTGTRLHPNQDADHRAALSSAQHPFAVLFGCSDSRLAAELIFDRGLGDLFVVRTAGHTVGEEILGSIEFGVSVLGAPLVVVLGHDSCGAIAAARAAVADGVSPSGYLRHIVDRVTPSLRATGAGATADLDQLGRAHVRYTVDSLLARSRVLAEAVEVGGCAVVGMYYNLAAGNVSLLTGRGIGLPPAPGEPGPAGRTAGHHGPDQAPPAWAPAA